MLAVDEALARILAPFSPLSAEVVSVADALGRVLAEDVVSRVTQPPKDVSAMDGYAVRAADVASVPVSLAVVGEAPAGGAYEGELAAGQAVRIFTGAPLPAGADAIVIQEDTEEQDGRVVVKESSAAGRHVRRAGLDFQAGSVCLKAGKRLTARDIGLTAAMNVPWVKVHRRPRIAILATGDEVVLPGDPLGPNQIVSSNGFALAAFVTACGGTPLNLGIARDEENSLASLAAGAAGADVLVTTGGASVGKYDLVRAVLGKSGLDIDFWKIAMRPGKPLMFGTMKSTPVLGLPGNPVSNVVCSTLFLRPVMERLQGIEGPAHRLERAVLAVDLPANDQRQDYLRARLAYEADGTRIATPFGRQDSSMLAALASADCLLVRKPHAPAAKAGDPVDVLPLGGGVLAI